MKTTAVIVPALAAATLLALVGCAAPAPAPAPTAAGPSNISPAQPSTPSTTALSIPCDDLVQSSILSALSPELAPTTDFTPLLGSHAATIAAQGGTACSWTSSDGTQSLVVAVAKPHSTDEAIKNLNSGSQPTDAFGTGDVTGYFNADGDAEVIAGPYWISAVSTLFTSAASAQPVILSVQQAVPSE